MDETLPNAGHRALAALESTGVVSGLITQNVDLLHSKAGSRSVVNLHGTYAQVICLDCGATMGRDELAALLETANPGFIERAESVGGIAVAPDADAVISETGSFVIVDCPVCGGMLKPDIVYFGENVPERPCRTGVFDGGGRRGAVGGGFLADRVFRLPIRPACGRAQHPGGHHQPRPHPRRRPGHRSRSKRAVRRC